MSKANATPMMFDDLESDRRAGYGPELIADLQKIIDDYNAYQDDDEAHWIDDVVGETITRIEQKWASRGLIRDAR